MNKKGKTMFHVISLILSIVAIGFMIGSEVEVVSASGLGALAAEQALEAELLSGIMETSTGAGAGAGGAGGAGGGSAFWSSIGQFIMGPLLGAALGSALAMGLYAALGASSRNIQAAWSSAIASTAVGAAAGAAFGTQLAALIGITASSGPFFVAGIIAIVIFAAIQVFKHKNYSQETYEYQVGVWQPATGGNSCEECNDLKYGCSEYQCKTYGKGCDLMNKDTEEQRCFWNNSNDIAPPSISFNTTDSSLSVILGTQGVEIQDRNGCIKPFQGLNFTVSTDKPAQCRWGMERMTNFLDYPKGANFGSTFYTEEHNIFLLGSSFPSEYELKENDFVLEEGTPEYNVYVLCESINGQPSPTPFVVKFCVRDGPDVSPPIIEAVNPINGAFVKAGTTAMTVEISTNEPANCSWDYTDKRYEDMQNKFSHCINQVESVSIPITTCHKATFDGLEKGENKYYVRCQDKPFLNRTEFPEEKHVANQESFIYTLIVSDKLILDNILINGEESGAEFKSSSPIDVMFEAWTSRGADGDGAAVCFYKNLAGGSSMQFLNDGVNEYMSYNFDTLEGIGSGLHRYQISCCDKGNNCVSENINFTVEIDNQPPSIARMYNEAGEMKIVTTESAECVYSMVECSYTFEDGISFYTYDGLEHTTGWDPDTELFILCKDDYDNVPQQCQAIARASDL